MSGGPLQGIRVLDLTSVVMGPGATQFFADYGADVVKIEPPEGDLLRTLGGKSVTPKMASKFLHLNRNKRSVVLDLKRPAARGALKRLCTGADVLVVNMRAAALKRLGLGYDELRALNEKLITCNLVGFGQSGRYAAKPRYDTIIQGSAGVATADGFICVSANTDKQAFAFFDAVGRPELKADRRFESVAARFENVRDYFEVRAQSLRSKTTREWLELLERADVPCMPYHTFESLLDDPHLREVGMFERVVHPTEGAIWNIALPNRLASGARSDYLPAPKLGQHTREVLSEAGLSEKEIEDLAAGSPPAGKISREAG